MPNIEKLQIFRELLDFFQIKNTFFIELSLKEDWISHVTSDFVDYDIAQSDQFSKKSLEELKESLFEDNTNDLEKLKNNLLKLKRGERYTHEFKFKNKDSFEWFKIIFAVLDNGNYGGMVQNITSRLEKDFQLKFQGEQNTYILDNINEVVVQYAMDGNLIYANPSFSEKFIPDIFEKYTNMTNSTQEEWFQDCLVPPYHSSSVAYYENLVDSQDVYIQWDNIGIVIDDVVHSVISIGRDISEMQHSRRQLIYELNHDDRSGFYNRRGILKVLNELKDSEFDFYYLYVSSPGSVFDIYGEKTSDELLEHIYEAFRDFENRGYIVGRFRNNEYVIINSDLSKRELLENNLFNHMNLSLKINNNSFYVTSDIGVVNYPKDTTDIEQVLRYGFLTMNQAYQNRNTQILRFKPEYFQESVDEVELINSLRHAIDNDDVFIVYQDVIDIETNEIAYVETLARWKHPQKGYISPSTFFALANNSYMAIDLDVKITEKTLRAFREMRKQDKYKNAILTINITPKTFMYDSFDDIFLNLVKQYGFNNEDICIEISENTFVKDEFDFIFRVNQVKKHNIMIAIDDFGKKYSSLGVLDNINFDIIKVDKSFLDTLNSNSTQIILSMIKKLSVESNSKVIVEGVEDKKQLSCLKDIGFRYIQGFYFSKPYKP